MKKFLFVTGMLCLCATCAYSQDGSTGRKLNAQYSKAAELQAAMDRHTAKTLPGLSLAVYSETEGWWAGASGYAKTETKTPMTIRHLQYLQSVSKTYAAVAALQLFEEGRLDLDAKISRYLPQSYRRLIKNADSITVRMLMNHTSGIAEYISHPAYTSQVLLQPTKILRMEDVINCIENEPPQFAPGSKYRYTNTNYFLLTVICDVITGDHAKHIREKILQPLGLNQTFYHGSKGYLKYALLPDSYWDILNNNRPANITPMQVANVATLRGDDGVVATPLDAVAFLKGLLEGKLLKKETMVQMQQWVKNEEGRDVYGLGLIRMEEGGLVGYGHGGSGLGAGCLLLYVPAKKLYLFLSTNTGVVVDGPWSAKVGAMKEEIMGILLQ